MNPKLNFSWQEYHLLRQNLGLDWRKEVSIAGWVNMGEAGRAKTIVDYRRQLAAQAERLAWQAPKAVERGAAWGTF